MKITYLIPIIFVFSLASLPSMVSAVSCGDVIQSNTLLTEDLSCTNDGLYLDNPGIILDCYGHTISSLDDKSHEGITVMRESITVRNCNVKNFSEGIWLSPAYNTDYLQITKNNLTNNMIGIAGGYKSNILIDRNNISFNDYTGIFLYNSQYAKVIDNDITNNGAPGYSGLGIFLTGDLSQGSSHNNISNNKIVKNYQGLLLDQTSYNSIVDNSIKGNLIGVYLRYNTAQDNITRNNISDNSNYGISLEGGSGLDSTIFDNYFSNNPVADNYGVAKWNVGKTTGRNIVNGPFIAGNFWGDYSGEDTSDDGIGDTNLPYNSNGNIISTGVNNGGDILPLVHFKMPTICIDPGHGGVYAGATGIDGITKEKNLNLEIANSFRNVLIVKGFNVVMTRETDKELVSPVDPNNISDNDVEKDIQARVNVCKDANSDLMISIHNNANADANVKGTSTFYFDSTDQDDNIFPNDVPLANPEISTLRYKLANSLMKNVMETARTNEYLFASSAGYTGTIPDWEFYGTYHLSLLRNAYPYDAIMPTSLIEVAFMSNQGDFSLLNNYLFKEATAIGMYNALTDYFGYPDKIILDSDKDGVTNSQDKCPYESTQNYDSNNDGCKDLIPPSTTQPQPKKIIKII